MQCEKNCQNKTNNTGYIILIVLYILLAIILGSYIF